MTDDNKERRVKQINYLTIKGASEALGVHEATIRQRIALGRLECVETVDGVVRLIPVRCIDRVIAERASKASS